MSSSIRWVCLSDMHFGDNASVLTNVCENSRDPDPTKPGAVLTQLVECLAALIHQNADHRRPALVLAGDILEFALATDNVALMAFERFLDLTLARPDGPLFSSIVYLPGNHDHHVWEVARETQYANHLKSLSRDAFLPPPWHTTNLSLNAAHPGVVPPILEALMARRRVGRSVPLVALYPSHGVFNDDGSRGVVFSHGHYIEPMYGLVSQLRAMLFPGARVPDLIWEFEAENFAWIDFFWSMMGRQGDAGRDVEVVYKTMQDDLCRKRLIRSLARSLSKEVDFPLVPEALEPTLLEGILGRVAQKLLERERHADSLHDGLSGAGLEGLTRFMERHLRDQILLERSGLMPLHLSFVFGHTHKPFERALPFEGYPRRVEVFNTGGWVVETRDRDIAHGATVALVDEALDVVAVEMFRDGGEADRGSRVAVRCARDADLGTRTFRDEIARRITPDAPPWSTFCEAIGEETARRRALLRELIREGGV